MIVNIEAALNQFVGSQDRLNQEITSQFNSMSHQSEMGVAAMRVRGLSVTTVDSSQCVIVDGSGFEARKNMGVFFQIPHVSPDAPDLEKMNFTRAVAYVARYTSESVNQIDICLKPGSENMMGNILTDLAEEGIQIRQGATSSV